MKVGGFELCTQGSLLNYKLCWGKLSHVLYVLYIYTIA